MPSETESKERLSGIRRLDARANAFLLLNRRRSWFSRLLVFLLSTGQSIARILCARCSTVACYLLWTTINNVIFLIFISMRDKLGKISTGLIFNFGYFISAVCAHFISHFIACSLNIHYTLTFRQIILSLFFFLFSFGRKHFRGFVD